MLDALRNLAAGAINRSSQAIESREVRLLREEMKMGALKYKAITTALLVASIAGFIFSSFSIVFYGFSYINLNAVSLSLGGIFAFLDFKIVVDSSYRIANTPHKFLIFNKRVPAEKLAEQQARNIANEIFEDTYFLKYFHQWMNRPCDDYLYLKSYLGRIEADFRFNDIKSQQDEIAQRLTARLG
ncbi:MAG: hypothetical protein P0S96_00495 [Simkaniaceae bacterium]|nr:hypothetical protein [Candidatus Sacchlamyda saccharinae]